MSSPWTLIDDTCVPDGHLQAKHNGSHGPYNGLGHGGRCVRNEGDVLLDHDTVGRIYPQLQGVYFVDVPATRPLVSTTGAGRGREARKILGKRWDRRGEAALIVFEGSTLAVLGVHSEEYVKTLTPSSPQGHDACSVLGARKKLC